MQLIVFKQPSRKLTSDCQIDLNNCVIKPEPSVKLLGMTLDQQLTMILHINKIVKKCHGLLGLLASPSKTLSRRLLKLAYFAFIRSQHEYVSSLLQMASKTHTRKLDIIQKAAVRIVMGAPRLAHTEPLMCQLELCSLETRRAEHMMSILNSILEGTAHPTLRTLVQPTDVPPTNKFKSRTNFGKKSFEYRAAVILDSP